MCEAPYARMGLNDHETTVLWPQSYLYMLLFCLPVFPDGNRTRSQSWRLPSTAYFIRIVLKRDHW